MNTDKFDKHAKNNLAFYEGFLNISKYVVAVIIITLALMAYLLVWIKLGEKRGCEATHLKFL